MTLFHQINFRDGVQKEESYELLNIVTEHFREKLASEITKGSKIEDDVFWKEFLDKKSRFIEMIRHGIEKKEEDDG